MIERPCPGGAAFPIFAWINLALALIACPATIAVAEDGWPLIAAGWYLGGSFSACALLSLRCIPTAAAAAPSAARRFTERAQTRRRREPALN